MNKMAEGDEYFNYCDKTLERMVKSWGTLLRAFLDEMSDFELTVVTANRG